MSFRVVQAVWDRSTRRGTERLVLLAIADSVNDNQGGVAWLAVAKLAKKARLSERQVQRHIRALQKSGELQVSLGAGPKGANLYKICLSAENPERGEDIVTGANSSNEAVTSAPLKGDASVTQSVNEPSLKRTPIVPIGDEKEFWINICFECFGQASRPLRPYFIAKLTSFLHVLEKKKAPSLIKFYQLEPIDSKEKPFNSRRHSPERLLLHLPEQLELAFRACPPPREPEFTIEEIREFLGKKYPGCTLPKSLKEFDGVFYESIRLEVYAEMRRQKLSATKCEHPEHKTAPASSLQKKEPPHWQDFFQSKYRINVAWPNSFDDLAADLRHEYEREYENFLKETGSDDAKVDTQ